MIERPLWLGKIRAAWESRPVVWLSGVRRVGKTTLAKMLPGAAYRSCDLPSARRELADPEPFYDGQEEGATVILDEVHRLEDPSQLLKIAADAYPHLRVLATGSSTLAATKKFRDTLTGRKTAIYLSPVLWEECESPFGAKGLDHRLLHGGLPEPLLAGEKDPAFFAEWQDSFYARDIQELFGIRSRTGFLKILELLLRQSGGLVEYTRLARGADVSRHTAKAHVEAMRIAHAVYLLPPFHGGGKREIVKMPKCYAFDTGFVTFARGWDTLREQDRGPLWEHLVLDALRARLPDRPLCFWRDKSGREVDFVVKRTRRDVDAIECKISPDRFDPASLLVFRSLYPSGDNFVVSPFAKRSFQRRIEGLTVRFVRAEDLYS